MRVSCDMLTPGRRYLGLWLPFLSAENRTKQCGPSESDRPHVFVERVRGAMRLSAIDRAAHELGLVVGLSLADARARIPDLVATPADPASDARLMLWLAEWCERFTPLVALEPPDGLMLDITGCGHLFGDEADLRAALRQGLQRLGFTICASIAATPDAARALARHGREGNPTSALPVIALEAGEETHLALIRAGLKTIGDLASRPRQSLTARFGAGTTTKLARILGHEDRRITSLRPLPDCMVERHFPEPFVDLTVLEAVVASLMDEAGRLLRQRGQGGRLFEILFFRTDGVVRRVRLESSVPLREAAPLIRLFRLKCEKLVDPLDPGFGFDALRLCVLRTESFVEEEPRFDGDVRIENHIDELIDRLAARLGRERVLRFVARDTHDPDRVSASVAALDPVVSATWPEREKGAAPARPLRLFEPPQPIEAIALAPDGPPAKFLWRRVWRVVARAEGPERVAPEWWRMGADAPTRDYYRLEDSEGRRFWVFREGLYDREPLAPRWRLHGLLA
jgi:protein ImuB